MYLHMYIKDGNTRTCVRLNCAKFQRNVHPFHKVVGGHVQSAVSSKLKVQTVAVATTVC